ncbi:MAG: hypothetical protein IJT79_00405 [Ruminococcus sp.]|nr:hypothetical protein [Ruminococcus sp.]
MKAFRKTLSVIITVLMVVGIFTIIPFTSFAAETDKSLTGIAAFNDVNTKTVVKFDNGEERTVKNAIKAESLEKNDVIKDIDSYEIKYRNKSVVEVEVRNFSKTGSASPLNGYYTITFMLPDTQKEVFLTDLTAENVDVVEKKLIANYNGQDDFTIEELDFIDAEKQLDSTDNMLCWAGTDSNMLRYTGWAEKAGFESEDDILDIYSRSFVDDGNYVDYGLEWFFDGKGDSTVKVEGSGGFLKEYLPDNIINNYSVERDFAEKGPDMISDLKAGKGVGLSINWTDDEGHFTDSAHAVTLFGVVTDKSYDESDLNYYDSFIIADSDNSNSYDTSDSVAEKDRHFAPNTRTLIELEPFINEEESYYTVIGKNYGGALYCYTTLEPYSDVMEQYRETNPKATLNRNTSYDFVVKNAYVSNVGNGAQSEKVYTDNVIVSCEVNDISLLTSDDSSYYNGELQFTLRLYNEAGAETKKLSMTKNVALDNSIVYFDFDAVDLNAGKYTAMITVNEDYAAEEAYFINNTSGFEFEVVDKAYDLSGVKLSIDRDIIEFDRIEFSKNVGLIYDGLDTCGLCADFDNATVYSSNFIDDNWDMWTEIESEDSGYHPVGNKKAKAANDTESLDSDLPDNAFVNAVGSKVKFRLQFIKDGVAYNVFSPEYPLSQMSMDVIQTKNNTSESSVIQQGASKLNDGERFAFTVKNTSVGNHDEAITGEFYLAAFEHGKGNMDDDGYIDDEEDDRGIQLTEPVSFSLKKGQESVEFTYNLWDENVKLNDSFTVAVIIDSPQYGFAKFLISEVKVQEDKSTVITTGKDICDPSDGMISLREAVAYANETGKEITVGENAGDSLYLASTLDIKGNVKMNGYIYSDDLHKSSRVAITAFFDENTETEKKLQLIKIDKDANVEIKNTQLTEGSAQKGAAVYIDGGKLILDNCTLGFNEASLKGGAVYLDGGTMLAKNTDFTYNKAPYGTDIFIDGGAKAELLNCNLTPQIETSGIVYNYNGSLDIINSTIIPYDTDNYDNYGNGKEYNRAIISNKNTNVVNSMVFTRNDTAVSGDVNVYSSVTNGLDKEVNADSNTIEREMEEICKITADGTPYFNYFDADHYAMYLSDDAKLGSKTSVKDGKIVLTDSNGNVTQTDVATSFTAEELALDMMGNTRSTFFGSFSEILEFGTLLTDENTTFTGVDSMTYTGKPLTQKFAVYFNGCELDYGVDYEVSYNNNINAGTATITVKGLNNYRGSVSTTFKIKKADNPMTVKTVKKAVQYSKVKKAKQTVKKAITVKNNKGAVSYKKKSGSKNLTISAKGVITVKKGAKKGTYKIKVKVTAKGTSNYKALSKNVTVTIKVK